MTSAKEKPQHEQHDRRNAEQPADEIFAHGTLLVGGDAGRMGYRRQHMASRVPGCSRRKRLQGWLGRCALAVAAALPALPVQAQDAAALKARHAASREALASNVFQRPLVLESIEQPDSLKGDILTRIDQPFAVVGPALQGGARWCDILILHLNVKQCRAGDSKGGDGLQLVVGQKHDQPSDQAFHFAFTYRVVSSQPDYLQVELSADEGPLGTSDYRVLLEAAALDTQRSILHLSYAYRFGTAARLATQAYLGTIGRDKVGFSVVGRDAEGQPRFIGGTRGAVERNTMRYYLAIEAYLGALSLPPDQQLDKRLADWHSGVERYPRQLRELERGEYVAMKREQVKRP
jgi:hypothetical protein